MFFVFFHEKGDRHMYTDVTGVILAGGQNSRFNGRNKAFFTLGGRRIIEPIIEVFQSVFAEVLLVSNDPMRYLEWDIDVATDIFSVKSSLTGIHTGLFYAKTPYIFVAACDTPFIKKELVSLVVSGIGPGVAAVIPETPSGSEPLFAAYSVDVLPAVENSIKSEKFKIERVFRRMKVKKIPVHRVLAVDPQLVSFVNINTAEDFEKAEMWLDEKAEK